MTTTIMSKQELYHEIFGSILDRKEMTPYLLRSCDGYESALRQTNRMMANRGFDLVDGEIDERELARAGEYVKQAVEYLGSVLLPFIEKQFSDLATLDSPQVRLYAGSTSSIRGIKELLSGGGFIDLVNKDPRHLFLLSSSAKYPHLFHGFPDGEMTIPRRWKMLACAILKMCHLIKSIEEDSQDINDYARLGMFLESRGKSLSGLFRYDWNNPDPVPSDESARRAFVKLSGFFRKLGESVGFSRERNCLVFDSGDGVQVDIVEVKARLKSPESMFAKLGKDSEEEAYSIRDILALTFLIKSREESLTLFHALQKRGVILQENTTSTSITQTLFDTPEDMQGAVRHLVENLAKSGGEETSYTGEEISRQTAEFFDSLSMNAVRNPHTSDRHRKFQCKIDFSVPVHRDAATRAILIPGTAEWEGRRERDITTQQHTLPVELRISDMRSWEESEQKGEAHHDAYKFRQLVALTNRLFSPLFDFPPDAFTALRTDQEVLFG